MLKKLCGISPENKTEYILHPSDLPAVWANKSLHRSRNKTLTGFLVGVMLFILLFSAFPANAESVSWDGSRAESFSGGGEGTALNPYLIGTAAELKLFADIVNNTDVPAGFTANSAACAVLTADIDLNSGYTFTFDRDTGLVEIQKNAVTAGYLGTDIEGVANGNTIFDESASVRGAFYPSSDSSDTDTLTEALQEWTPIGNSVNNYTGNFNGNGKTVTGLYYNDINMSGGGLFGYLGNNGRVKDLTVADSCIIGLENVGGVCGNNSGGTIGNCSYSSGTIIAGFNIGGICGINTDAGTIEGSCSSGTVIGDNEAGGVCGNNDGSTISGSFNTGAVIGVIRSGGVCGNNNIASISDSYNTGTVDGDENVGGVCGYSVGNTVLNSYNTGKVVGRENVGGVCGYNYGGTITSSYNTGFVGGIMCFGGVCGKNSSYGRISYCYNTGTFSNTDYHSIVCDYDDSCIIEHCYYLDSYESDNFDGTTYKTAENFADGTVAFLLNSGYSQINPLVWYQNLDNGETPDAIPKFTGGTVYYVSELEIFSNYPDGIPPKVISVTITWGSMEFTYTDVSQGTWNPTTLQYEGGVAAGWTCEADANKITVTNRSNTAVNAGLAFTPQASFTGGFYDAATGGNAIVGNSFALAGAESVGEATAGTEQTGTAYIQITSGALTSGQTDVKIGTVTVIITD